MSFTDADEQRNRSRYVRKEGSDTLERENDRKHHVNIGRDKRERAHEGVILFSVLLRG